MNVRGGRSDPLVLLLCSEKPVVWIRMTSLRGGCRLGNCLFSILIVIFVCYVYEIGKSIFQLFIHLYSFFIHTNAQAFCPISLPAQCIVHVMSIKHQMSWLFRSLSFSTISMSGLKILCRSIHVWKLEDITCAH